MEVTTVYVPLTVNLLMLVKLGAAENAKFFKMEYYHTVLGGTEVVENYFEKLHYEEHEKIPVIQPWPSKSEVKRDGGKTQQNKTEEYIDRIGGRLAQILQGKSIPQLRSIVETTQIIFKTTYKMTRVCSQEECPPIGCGVSVKLPPCGHVCLDVPTPVKCKMTLIPYGAHLVNLTLVSANFHFCRYNTIQFGNSRPFCGNDGGVVLNGSSADIFLDIQHADHYNASDNVYQHHNFRALISYQVTADDYMQLRTFHAESVPIAEHGYLRGGIKLRAVLWNYINSVIYLRTHSFQTGCLQFLCQSKQSRASVVGAVTRGAPAFRYRRDAFVGDIKYKCAASSSPSKYVCVESGSFTVALMMDIAQEGLSQLEGNFELKDVKCNSNSSWQCEKNVTRTNNETVLNFRSSESPIAYLEHTYDASQLDGYITLHIEELDVEGLASPRHEQCGAGGISILTEYRDWDIGIMCGGYASRTLTFFKDKKSIQLSKIVKIIAKKYFAETTIRFSVRVETSKCEGFVNMDFQNYPVATAGKTSKSFVKYYHLLGSMVRLVHRRDQCFKILFLEADTHEVLDGATISVIHRGSGVMQVRGEITPHMPDYPVSSSLDWDGFGVMSGLGWKTFQTRTLTRDTPLITVSSFFNTMKLDGKFLMSERGESLLFTAEDPRDDCVQLNTSSAQVGLDNETLALGFCGRVMHGEGGGATVQFPPDESSYGGDIGEHCCELRLQFTFTGCTQMVDTIVAKVHSSRNFLVKDSVMWNNTLGYSAERFQTEHLVAVGDDVVVILPDNNNISVSLMSLVPGCQIEMTYAVKTYRYAQTIKERSKPEYSGNAFCLQSTCYYFSVERNMTWNAAQETCKKRKQGQLWSVPSQDSYQEILNAGLAHLEGGSRKNAWSLDKSKSHPDFIQLAREKRVMHSGGTLSATAFVYTGLKRKSLHTDFIWNDGSPLAHRKWHVPRKGSVTKRTCFGCKPVVSNLTCIDAQCNNTTKTAESALSHLLKYLHPLKSKSHLCTAAIISDLERYSLLSIPCDDQISEEDEPFTLVCEKERQKKDSSNESKKSQSTKAWFAVERQTSECREGWITVGGQCLKLQTVQIPEMPGYFRRSGRVIKSYLERACRIHNGTMMTTKTLRSKGLRDHLVRFVSYLDLWEVGSDKITLGNKGRCFSIETVVNRHNPVSDSTLYIYNSEDACTGMEGTQHVLCSAPMLTIHPDQFKCNVGSFMCKDASCILDTYICDGIDDCVDGSDELTEACPMICVANGSGENYTFCSESCNVADGCTCLPPFVQCSSGGCIHPDMLCDGGYNCRDKSDEINCSPRMFTKTVESTFSCKNAETIPLYLVNDLIPDCPHPDSSDESRFLGHLAKGRYSECKMNHAPCYDGYDLCYPRHEICTYERSDRGNLSSCRNGAHLSLDLCIDHQCSGMFKCPNSYCIPYHMVCDGINDCPHHEDEAQCQKALSCPRMFKCRGKSRCVHPNNLLDGVAQCPLFGDDEKVIEGRAMCPLGCKCITSGLSCNNRYIMYLPKFSTTATVLYLQGTKVELRVGMFTRYVRLQILDLSRNIYSEAEIAGNLFQPLDALQSLNLSMNDIRLIYSEMFLGLHNLRILDLSRNKLFQVIVTEQMCQNMPNVRKFDVNNNRVVAFIANECTSKAEDYLSFVNLKDNPLSSMDIMGSFKQIAIYTTFREQCCLVPGLARCKSSIGSSTSACTDMFGNTGVRTFMWIIVILCILGNIFAFVWWVRNKSGAHVSIQRQVLCLTVADFLLAIMFLSILGKDASFAGVYGKHQSKWRGSPDCKVMGGFIYFTFEVSIFMQMVIPLDRAVLLGFSRRSKGLGRLTNLATTAVGISAAIVIAALYLAFLGFDTSVKVPNDLCLPFIGFGNSRTLWQFHGIVFVLLNINFFLGAIFCYVFILDRAFKSMNNAISVTEDGDVKRYQNMQKRSLIGKSVLCVFCHMFAWLFISAAEVAYLLNSTDVPFVTYTWIAYAFLLCGPLVNPIMYTFLTGDFKQRVVVKAKLSIRKSVRRARGLPDKSDTNGHTLYAVDSISLSESPMPITALRAKGAGKNGAPSKLNGEAVFDLETPSTSSMTELNAITQEINDRSGLMDD